ncbi:hypothetical protein ANCDUO_07644 [Ancylostoma duodenale]|uniref:Hexosyltransferase n=1 Tax=Ancylostoma duodenale TaxID=51022 RepID=A0A0C2GLG8_9BILA|nr:hypothetical protein ANCDUO_07644 [Ancylostoma duodenale]
MKRLIAEQEQYNDLIVTDMEESYENLVLKVYSVMVFFQQYCISATFLMKVDDDVLIHLDRMFSRWIETDDDENSIFCISFLAVYIPLVPYCMNEHILLGSV